jgi:hypothetical protein
LKQSHLVSIQIFVHRLSSGNNGLTDNTHYYNPLGDLIPGGQLCYMWLLRKKIKGKKYTKIIRENNTRKKTRKIVREKKIREKSTGKKIWEKSTGGGSMGRTFFHPYFFNRTIFAYFFKKSRLLKSNVSKYQ